MTSTRDLIEEAPSPIARKKPGKLWKNMHRAYRDMSSVNCATCGIVHQTPLRKGDTSVSCATWATKEEAEESAYRLAERHHDTGFFYLGAFEVEAPDER